MVFIYLQQELGSIHVSVNSGEKNPTINKCPPYFPWMLETTDLSAAK